MLAEWLGGTKKFNKFYGNYVLQTGKRAMHEIQHTYDDLMKLERI